MCPGDGRNARRAAGALDRRRWAVQLHGAQSRLARAPVPAARAPPPSASRLAEPAATFRHNSLVLLPRLVGTEDRATLIAVRCPVGLASCRVRRPKRTRPTCRAAASSRRSRPSSACRSTRSN